MSASAKAVFEADSGKLDAALLRIQGSMLRLQHGVAGVFVAFKALKVAGEVFVPEFDFHFTHNRCATAHLLGQIAVRTSRSGNQ